MNLKRQEYLVIAFGGLISILAILWALDGLQQSELMLEMRRQTYCFSGNVKYVLCLSIIAFMPALLYVVHFGNKIIKARKSKLIAVEKRSVFIFSSFLLSTASIVVCLFIGSLGCV